MPSFTLRPSKRHAVKRAEKLQTVIFGIMCFEVLSRIFRLWRTDLSTEAGENRNSPNKKLTILPSANRMGIFDSAPRHAGHVTISRRKCWKWHHLFLFYIFSLKRKARYKLHLIIHFSASSIKLILLLYTKRTEANQLGSGEPWVNQMHTPNLLRFAVSFSCWIQLYMRLLNICVASIIYRIRQYFKF